MASMYCKLFASLYQGTLRGRAHEILVFTNLLAHCDSQGIVDKHPRAIAEEIGLTVDEVKAALIVLESPDAESRSPEMNGARISRMDDHRSWGWIIVNHAKYSAIRNAEDRKEQNRIAQERWRNKNKQAVSSVSQDKPQSSHIDADTEVDKDKDKDKEGTAGAGLLFSEEAKPKQSKAKGTLEEFRAFAVEIGLPESDGEARFYGLESTGWKANGQPVKDWKASMRTWKLNGWHPSQKLPPAEAAKIAAAKPRNNQLTQDQRFAAYVQAVLSRGGDPMNTSDWFHAGQPKE